MENTPQIPETPDLPEQEKKPRMPIDPQLLAEFERLSLDPKPKPEVPAEPEIEEKEEPLIQLTRPLTFDDINYVMDNYDYDPKDDVTNNYSDRQAENFIRRLVVEYRIKNGLVV